MRLCLLCNKPIDGVKTHEFQIAGQMIHIETTVHGECLEAFAAEQAKRKPYRQPLEDTAGAFKARVGTMIQELTETVRDFD